MPRSGFCVWVAICYLILLDGQAISHWPKEQFTLFHSNNSLAQICHLVFEASILQRLFSLADSHYSSAFGFSIPDVLIIVHPK